MSNHIEIDTTQQQTEQATPAAEVQTEFPPLQRNRYAESMQSKRKLPKAVRIVGGLVVLGLVFGGGYMAYDATRVDNSEMDVNAIAFAQYGYLETYVEGSGQTRAKLSEQIGEELKGEVTEVLVTAGDTVMAGDILLVVDPTETREELKTAEQNLLDAQENLRQAGEQLAGLTVSAPFAGRLIPSESGEMRFQAGEEWGAGTQVGRLVDDSTMSLELYFSYAYFDQIKKGASATISVPAAMGLYTATVTAVEPIEKMTAEGGRLFRVVLQTANDGALTEDMLATASINVAGGIAMPSDGGTLEYARSTEIVLEASGKVNQSTNPYYYKYSAGQTILSLSNEDLSRAYTQQQEYVTEAQTEIDEINQRIADCTVVSPIDGMVMYVNAVVGEKLNAGYPVCTVADLSALEVSVSVPEMDIDKVQVGQMATITVYTDTDVLMSMGTVTSVGLQAEENSGGNGGLTFPAVISVDNFDGSLSPDRYVDYQIQTAVAMDCITVPVAALVNTDMGSAVFAKPMEGQTFADTIPIPEGTEVPAEYFLIPVISGISDNSTVEIVSGLEEGTQVYLAGPTDAYASMDYGMMG